MTGSREVDDRDRRSADERLQASVGAGRLSLAEYERRAGVVWAAQTPAELADVTADLPPADRAHAAPAHARPALVLRRSPPEQRWPSPVAFSLACGLAMAAVAGVVSGVVSVGSAIASAGSATKEDSVTLVVPSGQTGFDVGRQAGPVTVVVPDGVRVETEALDAQGDTWCDDACAWPTGPSVRLTGTTLEDVHVMSRTEHSTGDVLDTVVDPER